MKQNNRGRREKDITEEHAQDASGDFHAQVTVTISKNPFRSTDDYIPSDCLSIRAALGRTTRDAVESLQLYCLSSHSFLIGPRDSATMRSANFHAMSRQIPVQAINGRGPRSHCE
jgi:hypothetical protein